MRDMNVTTSTHLLKVIGTGDDQYYRVICPDGGANCECWIECPQTHRCDCGSPKHHHDEQCDPGCEEDHALDCDEWLWRDGMMHGEFHQHVGSMICVQDSGCWMPEWDIEFEQADHDFAPGTYEFDYEEPGAEDSVLFVLAMRPAPLAA